MILEIDIGNTRLKWRLFNAKSERIAGGASERSAVFLHDLHKQFAVLSQVRIACVAKQDITKDICEAVVCLWSITPQLAITQKKHAGLEIAYQDPSRLGVDRWLAMLAAYGQAKRSVCVIDCGSAITVDLVSAHGKQLGGYIVPGVAMQKASLLESTGQIRLEQAVDVRHKSWGRNTEEAVDYGVLQQVTSFINAIVDELIGAEDLPVFFITGGDAEMLLSMIRCREQFNYCPDLVMDGLALAFPD